MLCHGCCNAPGPLGSAPVLRRYVAGWILAAVFSLQQSAEGGVCMPYDALRKNNAAKQNVLCTHMICTAIIVQTYKQQAAGGEEAVCSPQRSYGYFWGAKRPLHHRQKERKERRSVGLF
jgi:hypothetical protein